MSADCSRSRNDRNAKLVASAFAANMRLKPSCTPMAGIGRCLRPLLKDQCTAWLACELDGGDLRVRHGWADVEGWSVSPSDPPSLVEMPAGFRTDGGPWSLPIADFLKGIDRSIEAAG